MQACSCRTLSTRILQHARPSPILQFVRTGATQAARVPPTPAASTSSSIAIPSSRSGGAGGQGAVFKTYKPLTPSLRHVRQPVHPHLHKGKPFRALTVAKRGTGGRNNTGRITTRFRGGGHKRRIRLVDFRRQLEGPQTVERIEYDPGRSAHIALIKHDVSGENSYILAPEGLRAGDKVQAWPNGVSASSSTRASAASALNTDPSSPQSVSSPSSSTSDAASLEAQQPESLRTALLRASLLKTGNLLPLHLIPPGTTIHCISIQPRAKATLCRSAGTNAKMVATVSAGAKGSQYAQVQLQSGEVRKLSRDCTAVIGTVSNREHQNKVLGKAGRSRWLGRKPRVRGVAMNATDHPHGGGRGKSKGNKHPRTPQGILTKGKRTRRPGPKGNKMVVRQRPRGPEKRGRK